MQHLHHACAAFDEATRQDGAGGKAARFEHFGAIQVERGLAFKFQIDQLRHARLHAEGHLILRDARLDLRIAEFLKAVRIHLRQRVQHRTTVRGRDAIRVLHVEHGIAHRTQRHAAEFARQKAAAPHAGEKRLRHRLRTPRRRQHHKGRQVIALAAETIAEPRAKTRKAWHLTSRHDKSARRIVVDRVRVHRLDQSDVIDVFSRVWQQLAHPAPALPLLREL